MAPVDPRGMQMSTEALRELDAVAGGAKHIETTGELVTESGARLTVRLTQTTNVEGYGIITRGGYLMRDGSVLARSQETTSFEEMMSDVARLSEPHGRLDPSSITSRVTRGKLKGKPLKDLCRAAWCEAFGMEVPSDEELAMARRAGKKPADEATRAKASAASAKATATRRARRELLELLRDGEDGVQAWNRRREEALALTPFRKAKLAGLDLASARLVHMPEGDFTGADLTKARLNGCDLSKGVFRDAKLTGAVLSGADLRGADLSDADLTGANLSGASLRSTVLTGARLDETRLTRVGVDESTVWPEGFEIPEEIRWLGAGPSPAELAALDKARSDAGPIDLETFMKRLENSVDKGPLTKALKMLKKDRFELFVDVDGDALTGVVKSQTDPDLVYACRLGEGGEFGCCTQNLNRCGGLRGGLCKHLLVLVVGLAQAGDADADTMDLWVQRARLHEAFIDQEALGAILLRYKGAQAGEIDWRPAETVPEDFYAF